MIFRPTPISWKRLRREIDAVAAVGDVDYGGVVHHAPLDAENAKNPRRFAQVRVDDRVVEVADRIRWLPAGHRLGIYAHELGHILDSTGTEMGADRCAFHDIAVVVGYDDRWPGKGLQYAVAAPRRLWKAIRD